MVKAFLTPKQTKELPKVQPSPSPSEEINIAGQSITVGSTSVQSSKGSTPNQIIEGIEKAAKKGIFPEPSQLEKNQQNE